MEESFSFLYCQQRNSEIEKRFLEKRKEIEETAIKREQELFDLKTKEYKLQMEQQQTLLLIYQEQQQQLNLQLIHQQVITL